MKPLLVIANSESGSFTTGVDNVRDLLDQHDVANELHAIDSLDGAKKVLSSAKLTDYAAVVVFGGDGTVLTVIKQLIGKTIPIMILPGGSANSLAREVDSPLSLPTLIENYAKGAYVVRRLRLADFNGQPMMLDAHYGLFAETLEDTARPLKNLLGQFAYALTMARKVMSAEPKKYRIELDGKEFETEGHVCFVVNYGLPRLLGQSLIPADREGYLRLGLVKHANLYQIMRWYMRRRLTRHHSSSVILSRRAEKIVIHEAPGEYSFDDLPSKAPKFPHTYAVSSQYVRVMVPAPAKHSWKSRFKVVTTSYYRAVDHARRFFGGQPTLRYSRIGKHLYLGGQYRKSALPLFKRWNVRGVVSMREFVPERIDNIDILHLPTVDHTPPKLDDLEKGVKFIQAKLDKAESVYIHCRLGEGRGPSMAAAYLISTGMRPQDAISHLQRTRPHARPNKKQVEQLMRFAERYTDTNQ